MENDENELLIEEVIQLSKNLQNTNGAKKPDEVIIIHKYEKIKEFALEKVYGEDEYNWSDIRQQEMSKIKGKLYRMNKETKLERIEHLTETISSHLRASIPNEYSVFFENIVIDLRNCAINRAVYGVTNNFYEIIFKVYKSGEFPCGWEGEYPEEGKLIAYYKNI